MRPGTARALFVSLSVLAAVSVLAGCMSKARRHLYNAEDLFEKRDLKGARAELEESIKLDPELLDAHKSLAHVCEYLGDQDCALREYDAASRLDPADQKLMNKARFYRAMKELANSADKALDDIKAGQVDQGLRTLKDILTQTKEKSAHEKTIQVLTKAGPIIADEADQLAKQQKYQDAINMYALGIRDYLILAEASHKQTLDPAADALMRSINTVAKAAGTPDRPFQILNEVLTVDPDNKAANIELAQVYIAMKPPDYSNAADLMERAGAPDKEVAALRAKAKRH